MSVQTYPQQLIPQNSPAVNSNGAAHSPFYYLIKALFQRTGGNSGVPTTLGAGLAAPAGTPLALVDDYNQIMTDGGGGFMLAQLQGSQQQSVYNGTGAAVNVYPMTGGAIDGAAMDAPYVLPAGKTQVFTAVGAQGAGPTLYNSLQLG